MTDSPESKIPSALPPRVRKISEPVSVPVFNCPIFVATKNEAGVVVARCATLADVEGRGQTEREALQNIVAAFKVKVARCLATNESIPWLDPPSAIRENEQQRMIAVHL